MAGISVWLFCINLGGGGAERQLLHIAKYWPSDAGNVSIVLCAGTGELLKQVPSGVEVITLSDAFPRGVKEQLVWAMRLLTTTRRLLVKKRPTAVISFLWLPTLIFALASLGVKRQTKLIWSVQSDLDDGSSFLDRPLGRVRRWLIERVIPKRVDYYIAISSGIQRRLYSWVRCGVGKVARVPNAVDFSEFSAEEHSQEKFRISGCKFQIISLGRLIPKKGFEVLLSAFGKIASHHSAELLILGEGPERQYLTQLAEKLGVAGKVHMPGFVDNRYDYLRASDVFISPSHCEPFGIVIAEAMAAGIPVIATATDGATDLILPLHTGMLVPVDDPDEMAAAIERLISDTRFRDELAANALESSKTLDAASVSRQYAATVKLLVQRK